MREILNLFEKILSEEPKPHKTKDKLNLKDIDISSNKGYLEPNKKSKISDISRTKPQTMQDISKINLNLNPNQLHRLHSKAIDALQNIDTSQEQDINDTPGFIDEPKPTENLPAKISKDMVDPNKSKIEVNWHNISDLPGYAVKHIRAAFRPLLRTFMGAKLEELKMATSLTTPLANIKQAANYIMNKGKKLDTSEVTGFGFEPDELSIEKLFVYELDDNIYMIAKEKMFGEENYYIISGPANPIKQIT